MKRTFKIIAVSVLVVVVVMAGSALFFTRIAARSPQKVTAAVQNQLRKHFPLPVTIARARLEWKQGPRVILTRVTIDSPGAITLRIKSITAYLSIWRLVFGDVSVKKLRLVEPSGEIDIDGLKRLNIGKGTSERPVVIIWKGVVKFNYQGMDIPLHDLSGRITRDWVNLRARTLGGRVLLQADLVKPGKITFDAYGIPLEQLDSSFRGSAHMSFALEDQKDGKTGSFSFQAKDLGLPFIRGSISKVVASASLSGDSNRIDLTDISIKTPLAAVAGRASVKGLHGIDSLEDAVLTLDASSKEFNYEKVVAVLPTQRFPDWLRELLTKQIRGGRSRFPTARYHGPLKDFLSGVALMDNLYVVQELKGQSFSAGYAPERITGITGKVIYGKGDIRFSDISGAMGGSRLKRVDIVFPGAIRPLMRVGVDVELEMPAADFIRTWHAAMVPPEIHKLLVPVSKVKNGQVTAKVYTYYDEEVKNPFTCKGDIRLSACSYSWGDHTISNQSGSIHADSFSTPLRINLAGLFDRMNIRKLDARLVAPFGESLSRYTLIVDRVPPFGKLRWEKAAVRITGSGRGTSLKGSFDMNASGISATAGKHSFFTPVASARGDYSARLERSSTIEVRNTLISTPASSISATASITQGTGSAAFTGKLHLKDVSVRTSQGMQALKGLAEGSLKVSWSSLVSYDANLTLTEATIPYEDGFITMDGDLAVNTPLISSDSLRIVSGDTAVTLSGRLTTGDQPFFKGNALIKGMGTGSTGPTFKGFEDLRAEAGLTFKDCMFSSLPVESATARAELKNGVLSLSGVDVDTVSGTAKGTLTLTSDGVSGFDMNISTKGADMRSLLRATNIKSAIDGTMDMEGRLYGSPDSLNGTLAVVAKDGEIRKYALVSQIFSLLNVYKIIQNRDIDFLSSHFTYNRITCTLAIRDSVMEFNDFALDSNSIQLSAVGTYSMKTKKFDAHIGVQPLESVDLTISKIPLVGWVLADDKGKMIVVNMGLKGTMDEPKVRVEPINTLSNTVAASLLRSLRLPGRLIDESLKLINGKEK